MDQIDSMCPSLTRVESDQTQENVFKVYTKSVITKEMDASNVHGLRTLNIKIIQFTSDPCYDYLV